MDDWWLALKDFVSDKSTLIKVLGVMGATLLGSLISYAWRCLRRRWRARRLKKLAAENKTPEESVEVIPPVNPVEVLKAALEENFQYVKKLTTVEKFIEGNVPLKKQRELFKIKVGKIECTLIYKGKITCGCDLQKIHFERDENVDRGVKILVPSCQIIEAFVDISTIEIRDEKKSILLSPPITPEEQNLVIKDDFERHKQKQIANGILTAANEKVREILIKILGNRNILIEIIFFDGDELPRLKPPAENS